MEGNICFEKAEVNFTIIANNVLRDSRVSLKARGLYATIQGFPDGWKLSIKGLESILKDGRDSIRSALKELIDLGYIDYSKFQNEKGHWQHKYKLQICPKQQENEEKPTSEKPKCEKPKYENRTQLINNNQINKNIKLNNNYIVESEKNCTDLSANADANFLKFQNQTFLAQEPKNSNQETNFSKKQNAFEKPKETGQFNSELVEVKQVKEKVKTDSSLVFEAYSQAIENLYKTKPLRNSKTNAQCKQLVDRLGLENALRIVEFYVNSKDSFYLKMAHSLDWCVKNAESLFLQYESGIVINASKARKIEAKLEEKEAFEIYESRSPSESGRMKAYLEKKYKRN